MFKPSSKRGSFSRELLPAPAAYLNRQGIQARLSGGAFQVLCPFHEDSKASLLMNAKDGHFCCMACGAKGGDVLAFHQKLKGLPFLAAAEELGALEVQR